MSRWASLGGPDDQAAKRKVEKFKKELKNRDSGGPSDAGNIGKKGEKEKGQVCKVVRAFGKREAKPTRGGKGGEGGAKKEKEKNMLFSGAI